MTVATLAGFAGGRPGASIVVCGCGPSLRELVEPSRFITIGVNDVGRLFDPTYLVVVNPRSQFKADRFRSIEQSNAEALFTQLDLGPVRPPVVRFRLGQYGGTADAGSQVLHYTQNSPYVAVSLAVLLGATRIGLIGVDFTDHHFFAATGRHSLAGRLREIDAEYGRLAAALQARGIALVNLSETSRLTSLPKVALAHWAALSASAPTPAPSAPSKSGLRIVSYATTPVAGVPAILARCISAKTAHSARCVWASEGYGNGVAFAGDVQWTKAPGEAAALLEAADLVVVHNGHVAPAHRRIVETKPVITMAHNYGWNVDMQWVRGGQPGVVVGQYQATLPEFAGWPVVPNPLPAWEPLHLPTAKSDTITIAYTPSGKHERYPPGHRFYWHGKGYETTMRVLDQLARSSAVRLETTARGQVSHDESLRMKQRAHIVIDECVTGSYHRNSLEALSAAAVVVNGVGLLPGVADVLRRCAPTMDRLPFAFANLATLDGVLRESIGRGALSLAEEGRRNRAWLEQHWDFASQWARSWQPVVDAALARRPAARPGIAAPSRAHVKKKEEPVMFATSPTHKVSVIIPHGGAARLPHLLATLAVLRQHTGVGEIIVAEMGEHPVAEAAAARWADSHLFLEHSGAFERARALNAGAALARFELVLWHDNDLLAPPALIGRAVAEMHERQLDFLIPYTSIRYLNEDDSAAVMRGERRTADCRATYTFHSHGTPGCSGGIGLVKAEFLRHHGGFIEGFRGWGGEDNAWNRKVQLLGRAAPTRVRDLHVAHLHHPTSGGDSTVRASLANPHYAENLRLLARVNALRDRTSLVHQFPPAPPSEGRLKRYGATEPSASTDGTTIWVYWEGPRPEWIRRCRRTIAAHAPRVRFLTPEAFDALRDRDRDIDLSRLQVAHRADYIRAFLLHRYGGLWIDADCLVMRPLQPLLDLLAECDFIAHRERSCAVSNGFIAARPGSRIAADFYARVCATLRTRRPLGWSSIGSVPLTAALDADARGWHELACAHVQPVCWSEPGAFFVERDAAGHAQAFDTHAWCYMLSNTEIGKFEASHPGADLLGERTFFSDLVRRSLGADATDRLDTFEEIFAANVDQYRRHGLESMSGPGSSAAQTEELRERLPLVLDSLDIGSLLDAPCGDFHWMRHVRLGARVYMGVDVQRELIDEDRSRYGEDGRSFQHANIMTADLPRADAILCRDLLPHLSYSEIAAALRNFCRSGATYVLTTTFTNPRPNIDTSGGNWRPLNLNDAPFSFPPALRLINERCSEAGNAYSDKCLGVWRLLDLSPRIQQMGEAVQSLGKVLDGSFP